MSSLNAIAIFSESGHTKILLWRNVFYTKISTSEENLHNVMLLKMFLYQLDKLTTLQQKPITLNVQLNHIFLDLLKEH